jgi:hypothetical protein
MIIFDKISYVFFTVYLIYFAEVGRMLLFPTLACESVSIWALITFNTLRVWLILLRI